jgi:hypothetical protein
MSAQAEEAAKRTAREAEVARKHQEDRAARAAAAAEWQEPDWVRLDGERKRVQCPETRAVQGRRFMQDLL